MWLCFFLVLSSDQNLVVFPLCKLIDRMHHGEQRHFLKLLKHSSEEVRLVSLLRIAVNKRMGLKRMGKTLLSTKTCVDVALEQGI